MKHMTARQRLLATFRGEKTDCVPVAPIMDVFASAVLNKPYRDLTWQDQVEVSKKFDFDLFLNLTAILPDVIQSAWKRKIVGEEDDCPLIRETLETPVGSLTQVLKELRYGLPWVMEYPLKSKDDLKTFRYIMDWITEIAAAPSVIREAGKSIGEDGVTMAWVALPLELNGWMERSQTMLLAIEEPDLMDDLCRHLHQSQYKMAERAFDDGIDLIVFGVAGTELVSPDLFRRHVTPFARELTDLARKRGRWSYLHMCGKIQKLLDQIAEINPTVFETFAPPPEGDTDNIGKTRDRIGRHIVAKGNMNLTFLATATPEDVYRAGQEIITSAGSDRFILGVADGLLANHPQENVRALIRAGHDFRIND